MSENSVSFRHASLLDADSGKSSTCVLSKAQAQVDNLVGAFVQQAIDGRSLAAMTAGGVAYRMGRVGALGFCGRAFGRTPLQVASIGLGLTAEVSAFELVNRGLSTLFRRGGPMWPPAIGSERGHPHGGAPTDHFESKLWRWSGPGGLRQGLLQSFVTFGTLKSAGHLARGENLLVRHLLQDTTMVLGHQASGALGIAPRPSGTLAGQFLHAEATNLQIGAGMALAHRFAPGITALEKGLDLSLSTTNVGAGSPRPRLGSSRTGEETSSLQNGLWPALASGVLNDRKEGSPRGHPDLDRTFMIGGSDGGGRGGIFEKKRQAGLFKEQGERLWKELAQDVLELFASTSLYARKVMWQGANRALGRGEKNAATASAPSISKSARLEAEFRDHPFNYRGQIEMDLTRLQETIQKIIGFREEMERAGVGARHGKKNEFFSAEDNRLFERLKRASALTESLSEAMTPGRFLKEIAERILSNQGLEDMVAEALPDRFDSKEYDFMSVGAGIGRGIGAKEIFRGKSKTGAIVEYAGRIRGISPISPRLYDRRTFEDLVREHSQSTVVRWLTQDDMKVWNSVFIPAIVVARGGNYQEVQKILSPYEKQLSRLSPASWQVTPLTAWWLCRAIMGEGEPLSWSTEYDTTPGRHFNQLVLELVLHTGRISADNLARELGTEGDAAGLAHALAGFLRNPYNPKAAMRQALRAPEKIREDALNLTGALLGAFHGAGIFSRRRLADWKNTGTP